jgi:hypothetical protein
MLRPRISAPTAQMSQVMLEVIVKMELPKDLVVVLM